MADREVWVRCDEKDAEADLVLWNELQEDAIFVRPVAPGVLLIEDGFNAARDRLIAHAQLLGLNEFDNLAFALAYSEELLRAAIGEG